jgi:autotransporter-associated beta strand protein
MKITLSKNQNTMKKYRNLAGSIAGLLLLAALPQAARAATGTWNVDADGLWSNAANWTPSFADGSGFIANFTNNITADRTVSLDSARTLGSLVFGDSNTATAGSWILGNNGNAANTLTGLTAITVNALGTGKTATISAVIAGSASRIELNGSGGGTLVLAGANTFNFTTNNANFGWRLNAGSTVVVASDSAFGVSTGTDFNASTLVNLNGGTLQASGSARTVANPIWLNGSTTVVSGSQSLTFSGAAMGRGNNATVTNNITGGGTLSFTGKVYTDQTTGSKILTFNGTGNTLISGNISNNTAGTNTAGAITKSGAGTLTLSGTNSYSGVTAVSDGTLLINGNSSLATGAVNVTGTGTLGGTGTTGGAISVATGGTLSPGASIESLKSGALTMASGSTFNYGIANASSTGADLLAANDTLSLSNVNLVFDLSTLAALSGSGFVNGDVLTLISYTGSGITSGFAGYADDTNYTFGSNVWKFNYNDTANGLNYASDLTGSNRVTLTAYNVVPEPNVAALLGGFGLLSLLRRRRNGAGVKS